jgi:hypothetical protein
VGGEEAKTGTTGGGGGDVPEKVEVGCLSLGGVVLFLVWLVERRREREGGREGWREGLEIEEEEERTPI